MRLTNVMRLIRVVCVLVIVSCLVIVISKWLALQTALRSKEEQLFAATPYWHRQSVRVENAKLGRKLKDWHDYEAIRKEAQRVGVGEAGKAAFVRDLTKAELQRHMAEQHGFNALLSDMISVNRSVADIRFKGCRAVKYLEDLPVVSIVIPFYNEHFSVLVRSLHSIVNRTPPELLTEIILIDDFSDFPELRDELDAYVKLHFPKVSIVRFRKRKGLIGARLAGAVKAVGDVLVYMDSHIETNYNWLPPLLQPIALDKRTVVCPFIDVIDDKTFAYSAQDEGARGAFDWMLDYKRLPLFESDVKDRTKPFENPIMSGGLFAIAREFFWELGGYDDGLDIWGGEQYELSFKIWMCGGRLLDAPCSRVGHIFRGDNWHGSPSPRTDDYLHKNYKRVAEVWMDDYKYYLYEHAQGVYDNIDAGDLTQQRALRDKLHCKSFKWFMENVAFDLVKQYPPRRTTDYAFGQVRNWGAPNYCLSTLGPPNYGAVGLDECDEDVTFPSRDQDWSLSQTRDLRMRGEDYCLQPVSRAVPNAPVLLYDCHEKGNDQLWFYDRVQKWLIYGGRRRFCLEARPKAETVVLNPCRQNNPLMRWQFVHVNNSALDYFYDDLRDEQPK